MTQLSEATGSAIELLRGASRFEDVGPAVLQRLAQAAGCDWAAYWAVDPRSQASQPVASWSALGPEGRRFEQATRVRCLAVNLGNAAMVWDSRKPLWSSKLMLDLGLPRSLHAPAAGLHGGIWFAVKTDTAIYGVVELLARTLPAITGESLAGLERAGFRLGYVLQELRSNEQPSRLH